jgi:hypothetical protein
MKLKRGQGPEWAGRAIEKNAGVCLEMLRKL